MPPDYKEMQDTLMRELRLYHYPVAVTWFDNDEQLEEFKQKALYATPVKPLTFCQWEIAARMRGQTILAAVDQLDCNGAAVSFGIRDIDEKEIKNQSKFGVDLAQTERFVRSKPRLPLGTVKAFAVGPLATAVMEPNVVHFYCDNMQSYHLATDYMAATDTHPLRPLVTMSSSACGGSVYAWQEQTFNMCPACSGSYNAGKTERGELNVFIPGKHIEATVNRLRFRVEKWGGSSITRPGDPFPGADICKNCPLIVFKKGDKTPKECATCAGS